VLRDFRSPDFSSLRTAVAWQNTKAILIIARVILRTEQRRELASRLKTTIIAAWQKNRQIPLRLARQPLRQSHARPDFR